MSITSFSTLLIAIIFIFPGFIFDKIIKYFIPLEMKSFSEKYMSFIFYSCCQYALLVIPTYELMKYNFFSKHLILTWIMIVIILFILPIISAFIIIKFREKKTILKLFDRWDLKPINLTPTSWDYIFNKKQGGKVLITCKDGTILAGFYGKESFASSDPKERDIFLQKEYTVMENGEWSEIESSEGILVCKDEIKLISFVEGK